MTLVVIEEIKQTLWTKNAMEEYEEVLKKIGIAQDS